MDMEVSVPALAWKTPLYPKARITVRSYEKTDFPDSFFDIAIGNVPFGNYPVVDQRYDRERFLIHDYFFAKTTPSQSPCFR